MEVLVLGLLMASCAPARRLAGPPVEMEQATINGTIALYGALGVRQI
jgi:hypothetical protein